MIANGVPVSFDFTLIMALFVAILGGYAVIWGLNKIKDRIFR
jgi:hypothetical protein